MLVDVVAEPARDPVDRALEARIGEGLDLAAVAADEMVMVVTVRTGRLEPRDPVACVHALDEA